MHPRKRWLRFTCDLLRERISSLSLLLLLLLLLGLLGLGLGLLRCLRLLRLSHSGKRSD